MKSVEECFLEIVSNVKQSLNMIEDNTEEYPNININMDYIFLKEYSFLSQHNYKYEGVIKLDEDYSIIYLFSNKRTFIYTYRHNKSRSDEEIIFSAHIINFKYAEYLISIYNLDKFIMKINERL